MKRSSSSELSPKSYARDIADTDRPEIFESPNRHVAQVLERTKQPVALDDKLIRCLLDVTAPDVSIHLFNRILDVAEVDPVLRHLSRVGLHMVLPLVATDRIDLSHALKHPLTEQALPCEGL